MPKKTMNSQNTLSLLLRRITSKMTCLVKLTAASRLAPGSTNGVILLSCVLKSYRLDSFFAVFSSFSTFSGILKCQTFNSH